MSFLIVLTFFLNHKLRKIFGQIELGISLSNLILTIYPMIIILMNDYKLSKLPLIIGFVVNFTYNMLHIIIPIIVFKYPLK